MADKGKTLLSLTQSGPRRRSGGASGLLLALRGLTAAPQLDLFAPRTGPPAPAIIPALTISCAGIVSAEAFGSLNVSVVIASKGIASAEAFGNPTVTLKELHPIIVQVQKILQDASPYYPSSQGDWYEILRKQTRQRAIVRNESDVNDLAQLVKMALEELCR